MIIVKVPGINGLGKTKGTRNAGNKILEGFEQNKVEEIHVDNSNLEEQEKLIYKNSKKLFEEEDKIIFLGGDHSITYPIGKAFFEKFKETAKIIIFDAHADCMPPMQEPTHEEWLRALVEKGFSPEKILLIGARKIEPEEERFLKEKKIKRTDNPKTIKEFVSNGEIYLSFDIDVLDPSLVKATSYPETGGLNEEQTFNLLNIILNKNIKAMDLVEINLEKQGIEETLILSKKLLKKFIS